MYKETLNKEELLQGFSPVLLLDMIKFIFKIPLDG